MQQRSPEWYSLRKTHIGASDAAIIMGVSPWRTPLELWQEKMDRQVKITPHQSPWMQRGIEMEPEALESFECVTGHLMRPSVIICPKNPWMMASLDGLELNGDIAVEIKCSGKKDHELAMSGKIPEKYIPQLQHQLSVTGHSMMYYFAYSPRSQKIIKVWRDEEYIKKLIEKESHFYHYHMLKKIPPENVAQMKEMSSQNWKSLADEYKKLDSQSKECERRKDEIKDLLMQISNSENATGHGISLQRIERKGIIPYSSIPQIKEMDLEGFRKPSTFSWRISDLNI